MRISFIRKSAEVYRETCKPEIEEIREYIEVLEDSLGTSSVENLQRAIEIAGLDLQIALEILPKLVRQNTECLQTLLYRPISEIEEERGTIDSLAAIMDAELVSEQQKKAAFKSDLQKDDEDEPININDYKEGTGRDLSFYKGSKEELAEAEKWVKKNLGMEFDSFCFTDLI